jgi:hypothetical protein
VEAKTNVATTCGRGGGGGRGGERVEEKEAVINRTNHANVEVAGGGDGTGRNGEERGWRCRVPILI